MTDPDYGQSFMGIMVRSLKQIMSDPCCGQPSLGIRRTIQYSLIDKTSTFMDTCPQTRVQFRFAIGVYFHCNLGGQSQQSEQNIRTKTKIDNDKK